jgi:hypothetical protein
LNVLPSGYTRFATDEEVALITGRLSPSEFRSVDRNPRGPERTAARTAPPAKGDRFRMLNAFIDFEMGSRPRSQVTVWLVLFRDSRDGIARTSQREIARRAGLSIRGVQKALARLRADGLVEVARRGGLAAGPSSYRVQAAVKSTA